VGVLVTPTLLPFAATGEERWVNPPIVPEPPVYYNVRVYTSQLPVTVLPTDSVKVMATYTYTAVAALRDDSFIVAETATFTGTYYLDGGPIERFFSMTLENDKYVGYIPAQPSGTTVKYEVSVNVDGEHGTSTQVTYQVSYVPSPPPPDPSEEPLTGPEYDIPPTFVIGDVILADNSVITWEAFKDATVWGTVHMSVTFPTGGARVTIVRLTVQRTDGGFGSGTWYWGVSETDAYTWILDWNTLSMPDGDYSVEMGFSYWTGTEAPPIDGGSGGTTGVTYTAFSAFGIGGSGEIVSLIDNRIFIVAFGVVVLIVGGYIYNKKKMNIKKRRI